MSEADEESGKDKGVAYLFVTKEAATVTLQQLRGTTESSKGWDVTALSLGALWFQLIDGESQVRTASADTGEEVEVTTEHIEYRLTPDYRDLAGAKMLLSQSPEAKEAMEQSGIFSKTYGEVPVFMDLQIRAEEVGPDGERVEKFPMVPGDAGLRRYLPAVPERAGGREGTGRGSSTRRPSTWPSWGSSWLRCRRTDRSTSATGL